MYLLTPDDFAGRPYEGGLNQMGHVVTGAALIALFLAWLPEWLAVLLAGLVILAIEVFQRRALGGTVADYAADLAYWLTGVGVWAQAAHTGFQASWVPYLPLVPVAAFLVEYGRIKHELRRSEMD